MIRLLSHVLTLAIPAVFVLGAVTAGERDAGNEEAWRVYLAQLPLSAPDCARDRRGDACVCADFTARADAEAYYAAAGAAAGRPFGMDFDNDGAVCEHLP